MTFRDTFLNPAAKMRGTFQGFPYPAVTETLCLAGVDFICADGEHSQFRGEALLNVLRAAQCRGGHVLVRVPDALPHLIAEVLDAGAAGVMVPRVSTPEEARRCVAASRYPPQGVRGVGPGRAAGYGYAIASLLEAPAPLIGIQIETMQALENLEAILATEGLDYIMIGPGDLGVALAASGSDLTLADAIARIVEVAKRLAVPCGVFSPDRATADADLDWAHFVVQGSDAMILSGAVRDQFA